MARRRFLILLILLALLLVVHPLAMQNGPAHGLTALLISAVFAATIWNTFNSRQRWLLWDWAPAMVAHWASDWFPAQAGSWVPVSFHLLPFLFLAYAVVMICGGLPASAS